MTDMNGQPKCGAKAPTTCAEMTALFAGCGLPCSKPAVNFALEFSIPGLDCAAAAMATQTQTPTKAPAKPVGEVTVTGQSLSAASKRFARLPVPSSLLVSICTVALSTLVSR